MIQLNVSKRKSENVSENLTLSVLQVTFNQRVSNGLQFLGVFRGEIFTTWLNHLDYISWAIIQHLKLIT